MPWGWAALEATAVRAIIAAAINILRTAFPGLRVDVVDRLLALLAMIACPTCRPWGPVDTSRIWRTLRWY